jgi:hypothetical protein
LLCAYQPISAPDVAKVNRRIGVETVITSSDGSSGLRTVARAKSAAPVTPAAVPSFGPVTSAMSAIGM